MLEVLYHRANFCGARISPSAGVAKNVEYFLSVRPFVSSYLLPYLIFHPFLPGFLLLTALAVLRMLPVLQRLGDAYGF